MPHDLYLIRLIHQSTHRAFPGERLWTAAQLLSSATVRFLRIRNREGCDVYIHPYAEDHNSGYILVDLDRADPAVLETMRANGHPPCVVLQTSPGHLQAWIQVSLSPLEPALATAVARKLAGLYGGDMASADWCHLGRLAGFTNQKPARRTPGGYAPWVKIVHARAGSAPKATALLQSVVRFAQPTWPPAKGTRETHPTSRQSSPSSRFEPAAPASISAAEAAGIYQSCVHRWRIDERFPQPDWSIVDLWVARHLLSQATPTDRVQAILRLASPHFPRRHGNPDDYLRRTLARAASPRRTVCVGPPLENARAYSNSPGGQ